MQENWVWEIRLGVEDLGDFGRKGKDCPVNGDIYCVWGKKKVSGGLGEEDSLLSLSAMQ